MTHTRYGGYSLLEVMLALALGAVLTTGVLALFSGNARTSDVVAGHAQLQDGARYALEFIARRVRAAGYFGCGLGLQPRAADATVPLFPAHHAAVGVAGHEGLAGGTWTPALPNWPARGGAVVPETDVLVVNYMEQPVRRLARRLDPLGTPVVARVDSAAFAIGDVIMVSDCLRTAAFRLTGMTRVGDGLALHGAAGGRPFEHSAGAYGASAGVGVLRTTALFIAPSRYGDRSGGNPSALWQWSPGQAPAELVVGIEDMQLLFGVELAATQASDRLYRFMDMQAARGHAGRIVSVRATLAVNSVDPVDEGERLVRSFSRTIMVRNPSPGDVVGS